MKFCYTHSEVWHFRIKYPKVALNHSFLMHPFSTPWKHQKTFQGIEKGCIGNESVKESFLFYPFLLEYPSVKFQFFNWHLLNSHRNFSVCIYSVFSENNPFSYSVGTIFLHQNVFMEGWFMFNFQVDWDTRK